MPIPRTVAFSTVAFLLPWAASAAETPPVGDNPESTPPPVEAKRGVGPFTNASYPSAFVERPLTLPRYVLQPSVGFQGTYTSLFGGIDTEGFLFAASFGVTDELQVSVGTGLLVHPTDHPIPNLAFGAQYLILDTEKLDIAPSAGFAIGLLPSPASLFGVSLGAPTRFLITDRLFLVGGENLFSFAVNPGKASIEINGGGGFQLTPELVAILETQLFHLKVTGDSNASTAILADNIIVALELLYAIKNTFDVFVVLGDDLRHPDQAFVIQGGVSLRFGVSG